MKRGIYTIIESLNISQSLITLEENKKSIHKALVSMGDEVLTLYFIDGLDCGKGTIFELKYDLKSPLVRSNDYRIIKNTEYRINIKLIEKLRSRLSSAK